MAETFIHFNRRTKKISPRPVRTLEGNIFSGFHENILRLTLNYIMGYAFTFTKLHPEWLVNPFNPLANLEIDFGNEDLRVFIEYQGYQHEKFIESYHINQEGFKKQLFIDEYKKKVCAEKGFLLICISARDLPKLDSQLQYIYDTVMEKGTSYQKHAFAKCWLRTSMLFTTGFNVKPGGSRTRYQIEFLPNHRPGAAITEIGAVYVDGFAKKSSYRVVAGTEILLRSREEDVHYYFYISPYNNENYERHRAIDRKNCILINERSISLSPDTVKLIGRLATRTRHDIKKNSSLEG